MIRRIIVIFLHATVCVSCAMTQAAGPDETTGKVVADAESDKTLDAQAEKIHEETRTSLQAQLNEFPLISDQEQGSVEKYSRRGDLRFFLGEFDKAEADYQQMVRLQPDLDTSHWRLGIAMYFAGHPEQAAAQFDKYHAFDNVDRENGIWRYLSHLEAFGKEQARGQLLKYEKDDRPPFREVYRMFDGSLSEDEVLKSVTADLTEASRNSSLFYAHLYIGMNDSADGRTEGALKSLRQATLNVWPQRAGYGPNFMWHVGRLQYFRLKAEPVAGDSANERE